MAVCSTRTTCICTCLAQGDSTYTRVSRAPADGVPMCMRGSTPSCGDASLQARYLHRRTPGRMLRTSVSCAWPRQTCSLHCAPTRARSVAHAQRIIGPRLHACRRANAAQTEARVRYGKPADAGELAYTLQPSRPAGSHSRRLRRRARPRACSTRPADPGSRAAARTQ